MIDLCFLNPSDNFHITIQDYLIQEGFFLEEAKDNKFRYVKKSGVVEVCLSEDKCGKYISISTD